MYGLVSVNLNGPPATLAARAQSSGRFKTPSVIGPVTTAAGLLRQRISVLARNVAVSARPTPRRTPPNLWTKYSIHPVSIGMVHVETIQFAVGGQVNAGLTLEVEHDARGV